MGVPTTAPFRRIVGTVIRGVGTGASPSTGGIPLAGATVIFTASIDSARSEEFIVMDPVEARTDHKAVLRSVATGSEGVPLLVTDNPSLGFVGWTWTATITAPSLDRSLVFNFTVPAGSGDLDIADVLPTGWTSGAAINIPVIFVEDEDDIPPGYAGLVVYPSGDVHPVT